MSFPKRRLPLPEPGNFKLTAAESDYVKTAMTKAMSSKTNEQLGRMGRDVMRNCQREVDSPSLHALDDLQFEATGNYH